MRHEGEQLRRPLKPEKPDQPCLAGRTLAERQDGRRAERVWSAGASDEDDRDQDASSDHALHV